MRAARGDVEWVEVMVMVVSVMCAVGPVMKWYWGEWKRKEKAREKAKEGVKRSKKEVENRVKEMQRFEEEKVRRRGGGGRGGEEDSDDDEDYAVTDGESEERRREKEARRVRVKKVRTAVRNILRPLIQEEEGEVEGKEEEKELLSVEDVELVVREMSVEGLEGLLETLEEVNRGQGRNDQQKGKRMRQLFSEQVSNTHH